MSDSDDVRARLEARVAERRAEVAGRHTARVADAAEAIGAGGARTIAAAGSGANGTSATGRAATGPRRRGAVAARQLIRFVIVLGAAAAFAFGLRAWVVQPFWIPSASMEPTLHGCPTCDPDRLLVDKLAYHLHPIHRGDVVVFSRPAGVPTSDADLVKRVIGLAGDSLRASGGTIYVNDRALTEPYVAKACDGTRDFGPVTVPAGHVFVMGDNRCDSYDSRSFGPIATSTIVGRAFVIVWPLPRLHWL